MLDIARRCVPFTPFSGNLSRAVVALVSSTGVHLADQEPFSTTDPGEVAFRVIPGGAPLESLRISHHHYDHSEADRDPNIVFPLETLRELASDGVIAGVADRHYTYGFTTRLRELYTTTAPELADLLDRSKTNVVLLTAG